MWFRSNCQSHPILTFQQKPAAPSGNSALKPELQQICICLLKLRHPSRKWSHSPTRLRSFMTTSVSRRSVLEFWSYVKQCLLLPMAKSQLSECMEEVLTESLAYLLPTAKVLPSASTFSAFHGLKLP